MRIGGGAFFVGPASVKILKTEERQKGLAYFRCRALGDISHLYAENESVSDSDFFQEVCDS